MPFYLHLKIGELDRVQYALIMGNLCSVGPGRMGFPEPWWIFSFVFSVVCLLSEKCFVVCSLRYIKGSEVAAPLQTPAAVLQQSVGGEGTDKLMCMCCHRALTI